MRGAGVCGTDLHIEADEFPCAPPVTMGHEVCGVVARLGDGVDSSWAGARVVSETYFSTCGRCAWCRDGRINLCPERRSIGSFVDGAFAPRLIVPARNLHRIPDWLDEHAAVLAEPLACVCHCLLDPPVVSAGDRVLVTGPGPRRPARRAGRPRRGVATSSSAACPRTRLASRPRAASGSAPCSWAEREATGSTS